MKELKLTPKQLEGLKKVLKEQLRARLRLKRAQQKKASGNSRRLTPSEIDSLRKDLKEGVAWAKSQLS